ncbi:MAG: hypothetical protein P8016_17030 [Sedimentisphaerales bacterium]
MSKVRINKIRTIRRAFLIIIGLAIIALMAIFLNSVIAHYERMAAFKHLCRNVSVVRANLDTWSISPKSVIQSFPQSQTVFGTIEHKTGFVSNILGLRNADIYVARLSGPYADDTDLHALTKFTELVYLELINTNVTEEGVNKFKEKLQECEIVFK